MRPAGLRGGAPGDHEWRSAGALGRATCRKVADPDEIEPGPFLPDKRLLTGNYELPVEIQGLTEDRVVTERVWLVALLQLLISVHVLLLACHGLHPFCWEAGEKQESAQLPDMLVPRSCAPGCWRFPVRGCQGVIMSQCSTNAGCAVAGGNEFFFFFFF